MVVIHSFPPAISKFEPYSFAFTKQEFSKREETSRKGVLAGNYKHTILGRSRSNCELLQHWGAFSLLFLLHYS